MSVCLCVRESARACLSRACPCRTRNTHTPADGAGRRARLPGRLLDQPRLSRKGKGPAARGGEREKRQKPPAFARNRGKTTMIPAVPPHCTPRPAFNFPAAAESFPPPSPSAGDERAKGPVHVPGLRGRPNPGQTFGLSY